MSFSVDISRFAEQAEISVDEAARNVQIKLFNSVSNDTRVDTGRLRGNWQTNVGSPITTETDRLDPNGTQVERDIQQNVTSGDVVYFTNNLPYAEVWEQEDGMVRRNMARIERTVNEVGRDVRR